MTARLMICFVMLAWVSPLLAEEEFVSLFNGKDLSGWRGQNMQNPEVWNAMKADERAKKQAEFDKDLNAHWSVKDGVIVNDGKGVYLTTEKDYGDFDLTVEWKMLAPNGDSGIYLRGYPQVQIWDPGNAKEVKNGADKGSGALWNNADPNNGKFPLVKADKPIGEWNLIEVSMRGERATIKLNGQLVVDNATLDNYFNRKAKVASAGPIQLQTHGSEMHFRNIKIREVKSK